MAKVEAMAMLLLTRNSYIYMGAFFFQAKITCFFANYFRLGCPQAKRKAVFNVEPTVSLLYNPLFPSVSQLVLILQQV